MNDQQTQRLLPSFRTFLCGGFRAERLVGTAYEPVRTAEWGGSNYPRILLKALVCCPGRQARRETLLDMLWPEGDQAIQNLNAATTKLRKTLQWGKGQNSLLVTEADSTQYRLEGQATLWVDAETSLLIGDVLFNQKDVAHATHYYMMAARSAQQALAPPLQAIVFGRYSLLLIDSQQARQALPFLQEALLLATQASSGLICSWLWSVAAEAYAHCDEEAQCLCALDAARAFLEKEERKTAYTFIPQLANAVFSHAKLLGYEGASYLRLGQTERAQKLLMHSRQTSSHPHHQSLVLSDYALTFIQQDNPQSAFIYAEQALNYIEQTHSARALQRLLKVRAELDRWGTLREVRDFDEHFRLVSK